MFAANQRKLAGKEASPKLVNIDLQPYQTVQACERADILNIGGFKLHDTRLQSTTRREKPFTMTAIYE